MSVWDRNSVGWREIGREGRGLGKELMGRRMTEDGVESRKWRIGGRGRGVRGHA